MVKKKTFLIAEIGINHHGNFSKAIKLVNQARNSGADAVKFQYFKPDDIYNKNSNDYKSLEKFYLDIKQISKINKFCKKKKIIFICTPFSIPSFNLLRKLRLKFYKIASMDFNNDHLINEIIKKTKSKIIISTGMATKRDLLNFKKKFKKYLNRFVILHCISCYPTITKEVNFKTIEYLKKIFPKNPIGFSDHTIGNNMMKVSLNYKIDFIEKHFTDNKMKNGADHKLSADVRDIKNFRLFENDLNASHGKNLFYSKFRPDTKNQNKYRRGIYFSRNIKKNSFLKIDDLRFVRPMVKFSLQDLKFFLNKKLKKEVKKDNLVDKSFFK